MTGGREIAALPLADRISFRSEEPGDDAFLYRLYAGTRAGEMALTGWNESQQDAFLRMQFQFQTMHYRKHYADASFQIILRDNAPIGRIYLHHGAREVRLMDIALLAEFRGSGIGRSIIEDVLRDAALQGKSVTLHVERFNRALHLYERLGFRVAEDQGVNFFMEWRPAANS